MIPSPQFPTIHISESSRLSMDQPVFYVYHDPDTNAFYYYDPETEEATYDRPVGALLLDPDTQEPFEFPDAPSPGLSPPRLAPDVSEAPQESDSPGRGQSKQRRVTVTPSDDGQGRRHRKHRRTVRGHQDSPIVTSGSEPEALLAPPDPTAFAIAPVPLGRLRRRNSFLPDPSRLSLPPDLALDITRFQVADYAHEFFREHRYPRIFERMEAVLPDDQVFQAVPLTAPLLATVRRPDSRFALEAFRMILIYTGAVTTRKPIVPIAKKLLAICMTYPQLRDEIYFQLIKQTYNNPTAECLGKTWDLLLIVATAIPASRDSESEIKSHLAKHASSDDPRVAKFAQFTLVRFGARCSIGKVLDQVTVKMINSIPRDPFLSHVTFGASIYEQLLTQREMYPRLPIPYILYFFANLIIQKGGERSMGIFRLSGNNKVVQDMIDAVNRGADLSATFAGGALQDVALVFKLWFANLPEPIVSGEMTQILRTIYETSKDYLSFVADMSDAHRFTLMFLCGFLKQIAQGEAVTKMGLSNLALLFSPSVVALPPVADYSSLGSHTAVAQEFMLTLLKEWDTSDIYPLPQELLEP